MIDDFFSLQLFSLLSEVDRKKTKEQNEIQLHSMHIVVVAPFKETIYHMEWFIHSLMDLSEIHQF